MKDFEANLIVNWYLELEERLCSVLQTTLYTDETKDIFLPPLANIIVDSSSLIDAIFRKNYKGIKKKNLTIKDFQKDFENRYSLSQERSLLYQIPLVYIEPFKNWSKSTGSLSWWKDYNALKHDRIAAYKKARLSTAVNSLCALQQVLSVIDKFKYALLRNNSISFGQYGREYALENAYLKPPEKEVTILVETELFATPVGKNKFPNDINTIKPYLFAEGNKLWRFIGRGI